MAIQKATLNGVMYAQETLKDKIERQILIWEAQASSVGNRTVVKNFSGRDKVEWILNEIANLHKL